MLDCESTYIGLKQMKLKYSFVIIVLFATTDYMAFIKRARERTSASQFLATGARADYGYNVKLKEIKMIQTVFDKSYESNWYIKNDNICSVRNYSIIRFL